MRGTARPPENPDNATPAANRPDDPMLNAVRAILDREAQNPAPKAAPKTEPESEAARRAFPPLRQNLSKPARPAARWLIGQAMAVLQHPEAPRSLAIALLLILVFLRPALVVFLLGTMLLLALVLYFSIGPDEVHGYIVGRFQSLRDRDPDAAERLRERAARISRTLTALADRLPDRWTEGLHIPEFDAPEELPEKMQADPFDRLAKE